MFTDNTDGGLGPVLTHYLSRLAVYVCLRFFPSELQHSCLSFRCLSGLLEALSFFQQESIMRAVRPSHSILQIWRVTKKLTMAGHYTTTTTSSTLQK